MSISPVSAHTYISVTSSSTISVSQSIERPANARCPLTDVVIKANEFAGEFCLLFSNVPLQMLHVVPFPLFMMTHICEPTHLSMSSVEALANGPACGGTSLPSGSKFSNVILAAPWIKEAFSRRVPIAFCTRSLRRVCQRLCFDVLAELP